MKRVARYSVKETAQALFFSILAAVYDTLLFSNFVYIIIHRVLVFMVIARQFNAFRVYFASFLATNTVIPLIIVYLVHTECDK